MLKQFVARGLLLKQSQKQAAALLSVQQRAFAPKKKKKVNADGVEAGSVTEEEHVERETYTQSTSTQTSSDFSAALKAAPLEAVDKSLFKAFSVGDVKQIQSTPDHKPPTQEDTIEGRYASVLFTSASQSEALFTIYEDIVFIKGMYDNSESFKMFTQNAGVGAKEIKLFNEALNSLGTFHPLTIKFLEILAENKRLTYISGIATRYVKLYQQFNKEEKITIISADKLSASEEQEVLEALRANPNNAGKDFQLEFKLDPAIKGGLQMYTETEFMDMSLASRMDKLRSEVTKLID